MTLTLEIVIIFKNCILFLSDLADLSDLLILKNSNALSRLHRSYGPLVKMHVNIEY